MKHGHLKVTDLLKTTRENTTERLTSFIFTLAKSTPKSLSLLIRSVNDYELEVYRCSFHMWMEITPVKDVQNFSTTAMGMTLLGWTPNICFLRALQVGLL